MSGEKTVEKYTFKNDERKRIKECKKKQKKSRKKDWVNISENGTEFIMPSECGKNLRN